VQVQRFLASAVGAVAEDTERTLLAAAGASTGKFNVGDMVIVTSGDLKNLKGEVVELQGSGGRVVVLPKGLAGFSERLDFSPDELQKYVAVGARVKVGDPRHIAGSHEILHGIFRCCMALKSIRADVKVIGSFKRQLHNGLQ
jgi:hypothetical protein